MELISKVTNFLLALRDLIVVTIVLIAVMKIVSLY